jgi:hypothetical protein
MSEITVALDEQAADQVFDTAVGLIPTQNANGSSSLGPFFANYAASVSFSPGDIDLIAPGTIRIADFRANWNLNFSFGIDLSDFLPDFCLPQVCINIPCVGEVCTPEICVDWPTISVPVSFGDFTMVTADFGIVITQTGGFWEVKAEIQGVPNLQFGLTTAALLAAIGLAITPVLLAIPFIGPFLAIAVNAILLTIGIAGITGFLGPIISPFISGMQIPIYKQPVTFQALAADGAIDPAVFITLDKVDSFITSDTEDELVLTVDIS